MSPLDRLAAAAVAYENWFAKPSPEGADPERPMVYGELFDAAEAYAKSKSTTREP